MDGSATLSRKHLAENEPQRDDGPSTKSPCDVSTGSVDPYHESDALQGLWRVPDAGEDSVPGRLPLMAMLPLTATRRRNPAERLGRALRAADAEGDASLNLLMLGGGALLSSAVLLTVASSAEVLVALIPWLALAGGGAWWVGNAVRTELVRDGIRRQQEADVLAAAVELLLRDEATEPGTRRVAAAYVMGTLDPAARAAAAARITQAHASISGANRRATQSPGSSATRDRARRLPS